MIVSDELLQDSRLNLTEKMMLACVYVEIEQNGQCLLTNSEFCQKLCLGSATVTRGLAKLSELKYTKISYTKNIRIINLIRGYKKTLINMIRLINLISLEKYYNVSQVIVNKQEIKEGNQFDEGKSDFLNFCALYNIYNIFNINNIIYINNKGTLVTSGSFNEYYIGDFDFVNDRDHKIQNSENKNPVSENKQDSDNKTKNLPVVADQTDNNFDLTPLQENKPKKAKTKAKREEFVTPTPEELEAHMYWYAKTAATRYPNIVKVDIPREVDEYLNYYNENGWRVSGRKMRSWKLTAERWLRTAMDYIVSGSRPARKKTDEELLQEHKQRIGLQPANQPIQPIQIDDKTTVLKAVNQTMQPRETPEEAEARRKREAEEFWSRGDSGYGTRF